MNSTNEGSRVGKNQLPRLLLIGTQVIATVFLLFMDFNMMTTKLLLDKIHLNYTTE